MTALDWAQILVPLVTTIICSGAILFAGWYYNPNRRRNR